MEFLGSFLTSIRGSTAFRANNLENKWISEFIANTENRAYEREEEINQLVIFCALKVSAVLIGPAGVGKSTIVNELACRMAEGKEPSLQGRSMCVLTHNLVDPIILLEGRAITTIGPPGVGKTNIVSEIARQIVEEKKFSLHEIIVNELEIFQKKTGKLPLLVLDGTLGLLTGNLGIFKSFLQKLEARNICVIATSLQNPEQRNRFDEYGRYEEEPLLGVVSVRPIDPSKMVAVLKQCADAYSKTVNKKYGLSIAVEDSAIEAIITLATKERSQWIEPERSMRFLKAFVTYAVDQHPNLKLDEKAVDEYTKSV